MFFLKNLALSVVKMLFFLLLELGPQLTFLLLPNLKEDNCSFYPFKVNLFFTVESLVMSLLNLAFCLL